MHMYVVNCYRVEDSSSSEHDDRIGIARYDAHMNVSQGVGMQDWILIKMSCGSGPDRGVSAGTRSHTPAFFELISGSWVRCITVSKMGLLHLSHPSLLYLRICCWIIFFIRQWNLNPLGDFKVRPHLCKIWFHNGSPNPFCTTSARQPTTSCIKRRCVMSTGSF